MHLIDGSYIDIRWSEMQEGRVGPIIGIGIT